MLKPPKIGLVIGKRGSGKTTLAKEILKTNEKVTIVVGGKPLTSQNSQIAEIALSNNLTLTLPQLSSHPTLWKTLQQGQNVDIKARITTGSGVVQVSVVGVLMTLQEYEKILAEWKGGL